MLALAVGGCRGKPALLADGAPVRQPDRDAAAPASQPAAPDGGGGSLPAGWNGCEESGWCWANPRPRGNLGRTAWGASADDFWASTDEPGTVMHFAGGVWARVALADPTVAVEAMWGTARDDVWAVGARGSATEPGAYEAAAERWDGARWTTLWTGPGTLTAVAGAGADDVWAVGARNVLHFDGHGVSPVAGLPLDDAELASLATLSVTAPDDVWIGGYGYLLLRWNGAGWTREGSSSEPPALASPGPGELYYAAGQDWPPGVSRWQGPGWSWIPLGDAGAPGVPITAWPDYDEGLQLAAYPGSVFAAGPTPFVFEITAAGAPRAWRVAEGDDDEILGLSAGLSFVIAGFKRGGGLSVYDGHSWLRRGTGTSGRLMSVSGAAADEVWMGSGGTVPLLMHWNGQTLDSLPLPPDATGVNGQESRIEEVWAAGHGVVFFAGTNGLLGRLAPDGWTFFPETGLQLTSVWGSGGDDVWAVGLAGAVLHFDGSRWTPIELPLAAPKLDCYKVRGSGARDVWISCGGGLARWDGTSWRVESGGGSAIWVNAPDDVWAANALESIMAEGIEIQHFDGNSWSSVAEYGVSSAATDVWSPGPDEVWVTGLSTQHYRAGTWQTADLPPTATRALWGPRGGGELWAVGWDDASVVHLPGRSR